jgi:hypothetical protein
MTVTARRWWDRWCVVATWLLVDQVLPGATLFALLLWLSQHYLRDGFGDVRQYAFAANAGKWSLTAPVRRNWWSCTCAIEACRCLAAVAHGLRRCCVKVLQPALQLAYGASPRSHAP